jgi:hypothetical protein
MAMLLWWSIDEVRHGTTKYRKTIGAVTPSLSIRTITDRRRCRSIPTYCPQAYSVLTGASFVVST